MRFLDAVVKDASAGGFEAIASMPTLDRDGEVIAAKAFEPLASTVPVHAFHDFSDPVGRGQPYYEGATLMISGTFSRTARAQEVRQLVLDGTLRHMSVGFLPIDAAPVDGVRTIRKAELLEVSFVSVPSNRESQILAVRDFRPRSAVAAARKELAVAEAWLALIEAEAALTQRPIRRDVDRFLREQGVR